MSFRLRFCVPLLLLPLFGCGPERNAFPPVCPTARLLPALADVTRYAGPGPAHDATDLVVQGRIMGVNGSCQEGDKPSVLAATVRITVAVQRGPAMKGRAADIPIFLAVTEGGTVKDKQIFPVHVVFPPNVDHMTSTSAPISLDLPVSHNTSGAAYAVIAGFQLTPEELAANRQAGGG